MTTLDIDRFIIEIEDRPAIWDLRCDDYSSKIAKAKAWEEMCDIFVPGFREMDSAGKTKAGMFLYYSYNKVHVRLRYIYALNTMNDYASRIHILHTKK